MSVFTAVLVACLSLTPEPSGCQTHEMLIQGSNPTAVFIEAQNKAAIWLGAHPNLRKISLTISPGRET